VEPRKSFVFTDKAKRAGAYVAIQVHRVGVTEGTSTNVFGVKDGVVYTAPNGNRILPDTTRGTILELANKNGIEAVETFLSVGELLYCDEVFISSTTNKILPVKQIDQATFPVANYRITFHLQQLLENHILETRE